MGCKDIFVETENKQLPEEKQSTITASPVVNSISAFPSGPSTDQASLKKLQDSLAKQVPESIKNLEEHLQMFADTITDESIRLKASVKATKIPIEIIISDYDKCFSILDGIKAAFDQKIKERTSSQIDGRQAQIAQLEQSTQAKRDQINQLTKEIGDIDQQKSNFRTEITTEQIQIDNVVAGFSSAFETTKTDILNKKNKISTYGR